MKPRRWVLILAAALLAGAVLLHAGLRMLERSRGIERILVERISPLVGGGFNVGRVHLGLFVARLEDVHLVLPMSGLRIEVRRIKIGFSLWRLIMARGDLGQSISRIVLLEPDLSLTMLAGQDSAAIEPVDLSFFQRLPVDYLSLERGTARIVDRGGHSFVFGQRLSGRIGSEPAGVVFELRGSVASRKRNLAISGAFARSGGRHRMSLRLERARMDRRLMLGAVTVLEGTLDGVCEFAFGDTLLPATVDAHGSIHVDQGSCRIDGLDGDVDSIRLALRLAGTQWRIDTLSGRWKGVVADAAGMVDMADYDTSRVDVRCVNIDLRRVAPGAPALIADQVLGSAWCALSVVRAPGAAVSRIAVTGGGITVAGIPVTAVTAHGSAGRADAALDSLRVDGTGLQVRASGIVSYSKAPWVYDLRFDGSVDTCPSVPLLQGNARFEGTARGRGEDVSVDAEAHLTDAGFGAAPLGNPVVHVTADARHADISWDTRTGDFTSGTFLIDSIATPEPTFRGTATMGKRTLLPLLAWMPDSLRASVRDLRGDVTMTQSAGALRCSVLVRTDGAVARGSARVLIGTLPQANGAALWRLKCEDLNLHDSLVALAAGGRWWPESLSVDSLQGLGGLSGRCRVQWGQRPTIDASLDVNKVGLRALNRWFSGGGLPLDGGTLSGKVRISGAADSLLAGAELHVRDASVSGIQPLATDAVVRFADGRLAVRPLVVRKDRRQMLNLDTLAVDSATILTSGTFDDVDLGDLLRDILPEDLALSGGVSGRFASSPAGYPVVLHARSPRLRLNTWTADSVLLVVGADRSALQVRDLRCADSARSRLWAEGSFPYALFAGDLGDGDTARMSLRIEGDLLATIQRNFDSPIGGHGEGEGEMRFEGTSDGWVCTSGSIVVPQGTLTVLPFVASRVDRFSARINVGDSSMVDIEMRGQIGRKRITVFSTHDLPSGYEGLKVGPLDLGALQVWTPDRGVDLHLPGFMEIGEVGQIEFAAKKPFEAFTISGPFDRLKLTGTWVLHDVEFTFPFLVEPLPWELDPFPFVTWEMDLVPGRKTMYFWDLRGKRRQLVRFFEAFIDKSSKVMVRGREGDRTFRLQGSIRSYKGAVYYGKVFDRNLKVGLDFAPQQLGGDRGYDNLPVIWGSVEAFSDSSRFDRVTLTLQLQDPVTGGVSEKGRIAMVPAARGKGKAGAGTEERPNFVFHLSSSFEEAPGESELEFYREAGLQFSSLEGATEFVSNFGEQYLHRYFLQRFERRLAKLLGLDVITFETSIASNYFSSLYNRRYGDLYSQWNLLANMGITVGRYFLNDNVFLKARGEFVPSDTAVRPEYSVGLEFSPAQYFVMDVDYGFYVEDQAFQQNPRVQMQLRLPITRLRNMFNF